MSALQRTKNRNLRKNANTSRRLRSQLIKDSNLMTLARTKQKYTNRLKKQKSQARKAQRFPDYSYSNVLRDYNDRT